MSSQLIDIHRNYSLPGAFSTPFRRQACRQLDCSISASVSCFGLISLLNNACRVDDHLSVPFFSLLRCNHILIGTQKQLRSTSFSTHLADAHVRQASLCGGGLTARLYCSEEMLCYGVWGGGLFDLCGIYKPEVGMFPFLRGIVRFACLHP